MPHLFLSSIVFSVSLIACNHVKPESGLLDKDPLFTFDTSIIQLVAPTHKLDLRVEVAATEEQRAVGLMERAHLPENAGMLFTYTEMQTPEIGFWMFHTWFPLDVAFLDARGKILAIRSMEPCMSSDSRQCPSYTADVPYFAALEVNRGFFEENGFRVGDRVLVAKVRKH